MCSAVALVLTLLASSQAGFKNGLPTDPGYFPIAVWLQDPALATKYKAAGFNLYVGLWQGPNEDQLKKLRAAGMPVFCDQNVVGLAHLDDPTIAGWLMQDEPDNAQSDGKGGYGPCVPPSDVVKEYKNRHAADPTRPVLLNLGQGIANDEWIGRGSGASLKDYETYVKGGDIISYDIYPIAGLEKPTPEDYLWYVAKGLDRLGKWMGGTGTRWNCIECTRISGSRKATPAQVRSEVWMSIIHGSRGLIFFVHQFSPKFNEHALLDDPEMLAEVTKLNGQIKALAPVINSPEVVGVVAVTSTNKDVPIDIMVKRKATDTYVFAISMRNGITKASFVVKGAKSVEVVGENRTLKAVDDRFEDGFSAYAVHIYRVTDGAAPY